MPKKRLGEYEIFHLQVLDENAEVDHELEPSLSEEKLLYLYRSMLLAREADQRMLKLQRQGRLGTFPPSTGHEGVVCGATLALSERDWFVGTYRELGGRLMRGVPLAKELLYYNGYEEGNLMPSNVQRTLPIAIVLASQLPIATGLAYAMKYQGEEGSAVLAFVGDGASSQGDFHEALNFASTWKVPVVFLCVNNQWAISVPLEKQMNSKSIAQRAIAYDIPGIQVDGNDPLGVYQATQEALERARRGEGPSLIEARCYRLIMHTTADDPSKYREKEETEVWWARDALPRFRRYLEGKGIWDEAKEEALRSEIKEEIAQAVDELEHSHDLPLDAPFEHLFGTRHEEIEAQQAEFNRSLKLEERHDA